MHDLSSLPDIDELQRLTQSLALLDAVLSPDWEMRYYSFNSRWAQDEMMASMRNGSGDDWFLLFSPVGTILKGYAHESPMAAGAPWSGVLSGVPPAFQSFLTEPAFSVQDATFCFWCLRGESEWQRGSISFPPDADPDGSEELLALLDGKPETYQAWAEESYECAVSLDSVRHIYRHRALTADTVRVLNPDVTLSDLADDIAEIGYPAIPTL